MIGIPFSTFHGYLKKLDLSQLSEIERTLFEHLFPQFFTKREIDQATRERNKEMIRPFRPLLEYEEDLDQPRRFAGVSLPRGRYYTVCKSSTGDDGSTLVNELRAYRDPNATGRVDVVDLAREPHECLGPPRPALAVILYDVDKIPVAEQLLKSAAGARGNRKLLIIEYPYEVLDACIEKTIDLRLSKTRRWFFDQFSKEQEDGSLVWVTGQKIGRTLPKELWEELERNSVTIVSRFQRTAGIAPTPRDFYAMLPTLMNPEQGGGTTSDGGAILQAIGTWMCRNEVGALIYPSARSDAFVELVSGTIRDYGGWNLVDYRGAVDKKRVQHFFIVESPWAWTAFPRDVRIEVKTEHSAHSDSFLTVGMEAYWRRDYEYRLKSLEAVDAEASIAGEDVLFGRGQEVTKAAAWRMGSSSIEWLTLNAVDRKPEEGVREKFLFSGLASRLDRPYAAGRIDEIERNLVSTGAISDALGHCMDLVDWVAVTWKNAGMSVPSCILVLSNRLHVLRFFVAGSLLARKAGLALDAAHGEQVSVLLGELDMTPCALSENTRGMIETTIELGVSLCGGDVRWSSGGPVYSDGDWQQNWDQMCKTVWEELCRSR